MLKRRHVTRQQVERARGLRQKMSAAERVFWKIARNHQLGFEVRRQHPIGNFILDFYCKEAALAIEFDGEQHEPARDKLRDEALKVFGIETMRIPNRQFFALDSSHEPRKDWVEAIVRRCEERSGRRVLR